jgi:hypothetical protein
VPEGQRALSHAVASPPLVNVSSVISIVCALVTRLRPGHRARYPDRDPLLRTLLTVLTVVSSGLLILMMTRPRSTFATEQNLNAHGPLSAPAQVAGECPRIFGPTGHVLARSRTRVASARRRSVALPSRCSARP